MKLFSRKALVAGAAAVALSFAGTSAAVAAEETTTEATTTQAPSGSSNLGDAFGSSTDKTTTEPTEGDKGGEDGDGSSDMKPKDISAWISVFTAVIGALGALFSFASKYLGFKL